MRSGFVNDHQCIVLRSRTAFALTGILFSGQLTLERGRFAGLSRGEAHRIFLNPTLPAGAFTPAMLRGYHACEAEQTSFEDGAARRRSNRARGSTSLWKFKRSERKTAEIDPPGRFGLKWGGPHPARIHGRPSPQQPPTPHLDPRDEPSCPICASCSCCTSARPSRFRLVVLCPDRPVPPPVRASQRGVGNPPSQPL